MEDITPKKPTTEPISAKQPSSNNKAPSKGMKLIVAVIVLVIAGLAIYSLVKIFTKDDTTSNQTNTTVQVAKVSITDKGFVPATLTIKAGTTVEWVSTDSKTTHVVAANPYPSHSDLPELVSPQLGNGATYRFTFKEVGTYKYHDDLKPTTNAVIVVE